MVLMLRFGLIVLNQVSPADWAAVVGSRADAQVLTSTRGNIATIGMLFVFVIYPGLYRTTVTNFRETQSRCTTSGWKPAK
jgi:hypothetical protein